MKRVMQQFEDRTTQRFHEYDERMKTTRQKCKDKCDKEIQKIILKDKLEKELMDKFATLDTDIQSDAIPTCVCEKSLADKTEKLCLKCGYGLGSNIPLVGLISGIGFYSGVLEYAVDFGISEGVKAAISKGMEVAIQLLTDYLPALQPLNINLASIITKTTYYSPMYLGRALHGAIQKSCVAFGNESIQGTICASTITSRGYLYGTAAEVAREASKAGIQTGAAAAKEFLLL
ncbi:hypothetical protein PFBG_00171 [Plasmodium falciparum 7G8]|uniref:Rifin n=1 Tax=Plasmodium falciparum (isolate 7G8) TaxID=57266 RepID=W7F8B6_PLAF8|nr:hypothetical protein PFBG_00171 [Plasmodium falciparum 7G8]